MPEMKPPIRGKTSPYGFFVKMCYEEHKKKYPNEAIEVAEISRKCAEKWKTMSEEDKRRFVELSSKDAERYQAEVAAYGGEDYLMKKKKKKTKDPGMPKRALSAFFYFSQERRTDVLKEHPEWKLGQVAQELGKRWKEMSPEERSPFEEKAAHDKARYEEEMKLYRGAEAAAPQQIQIQQHHQMHQQQHIPMEPPLTSLTNMQPGTVSTQDGVTTIVIQQPAGQHEFQQMQPMEMQPAQAYMTQEIQNP